MAFTKILLTLGLTLLLAASIPAASAQSPEDFVAEAFQQLDAGQESRARRNLERADNELSDSSDPELRGRPLGWARYWRWRRSWDRAAEHAVTADELLGAAGSAPDLVAEARYQAGYAFYRANDIREAHEAFASALAIYAAERDLLDGRRLRANGWATMTRELADRLERDEREDGSGVFVIAQHARPEDGALQAIGPVWAHTESPGFDVTAWHGRMDGFVVALVDAGPDGEPVNLRVLESHPGDLWDLELRYALRTWRLDLSDPDARRTDIAVTFVWAVQRHQR